MRVNDRAGIAIVVPIGTDRLYENGSGNPFPGEIAENRITTNCTICPPVSPRSPRSTREVNDVVRHRMHVGISDGWNGLRVSWGRDG